MWISIPASSSGFSSAGASGSAGASSAGSSIPSSQGQQPLGLGRLGLSLDRLVLLVARTELLDPVAELRDQLVGLVDLIAPRQIFGAVHLLTHGIVAVIELAKLLLRLFDLVFFGIDGDVCLGDGGELNGLFLGCKRGLDRKVLGVFQILSKVHNEVSFPVCFIVFIIIHANVL